MKKPIILALFFFLFFFNANALTLLHPKATKVIAADEGVKMKFILGNKTYELISYALTYIPADKGAAPVITPTYTYNTVNNVSLGFRSSKIDQELLDWVLSSDSPGKDGQIIITDAETGKMVKTIQFTLLKPATYAESFYNSGLINTSIQANITFNMHFNKIAIKF